LDINHKGRDFKMNYWTDSNGNMWSKEHYSEEDAIAAMAAMAARTVRDAMAAMTVRDGRTARAVKAAITARNVKKSVKLRFATNRAVFGPE
jgi:hypothetical protein